MDWFGIMIYSLAALLAVGVPWALWKAWDGNWRHFVRVTATIGFASVICTLTALTYDRHISEDYESLALLFIGAGGFVIAVVTALVGAVLHWLGGRRRRRLPSV